MRSPKRQLTALCCPAVEFVWGNDNWRAMVWGKVTIANMIVQHGFNLVLTDTDVVWFKDPNEILQENKQVGERAL